MRVRSADRKRRELSVVREKGAWMTGGVRVELSAQQRSIARNLLIALLLLVASVTHAQTSPELQVGVYETAMTAAPQEVEQLPSSAFHAPPPGQIELHGDADRAYWLRLDVNLPPLADDDARWMLWLDRARVDRLALHLPDESRMPAQPPLDFFVKNENPAAHTGGYGFALPRGLSGSTTLYLEVAGQGTYSLSPSIRSEADAAATDRGAMMLFTAVYTGLILLIVIGLGMYIALRDRLYLYYLTYLGILLVFLLAHNGHLYALPWIGKWGHWRTLGLYALANLLAAATVALARQFAGLVQSMPRVDRFLALFPAIPLLLALLCLLNREELAQPMQVASVVVALGAMLLAALATALAWRQRRHLAFPMLLMWLLLSASGCVRALIPYGLVPSNGLTQYSDQVVAALTALMLGFALSDRIIEFRLQRDRARLAKDQVDASLRLERERRKFVESLADLRDANGGDQEWMAFRRLLESLRQLVPQQSSAVALYGFHGADLLLCEPNASRDSYQTLLSTRGGAFKGISRSQLPMQLRIDMPTIRGADAPDLLQFAVLPLPLTSPAWGVLLIERRGWQTFERDELTLASEFSQKATQAVEAAANDRALRRSAEFDALTGAFNRRTVNARLEASFKLSLARHTPLSVLFVDLDHLKDLNDKHGHAAGDSCLRMLAETLTRNCGNTGVYGRYGGDEFVVILPDLNPEQARRWAEAMRVDATSQDMKFPSGTLRLRVSVGVATRRPEDNTAHELVERADQALYEAKRMGRDRVHASPSGPAALRGEVERRL